jgi:translation initiation factor 2 subunit 1
MEEIEFPEIGEAVICTVTKVLNYGAFVELTEYEGAKGFVHVSQVASGWIKNIRNYVKEGQVRAAKVVSIDNQKNQIDLSFTKITSHEARARIEEWKQLKRARKFMEQIAQDNKSDFDTVWDEIAIPLVEQHGSLQKALQEIALERKGSMDAVPKKWQGPLQSIVEKSVTVQAKTLAGTFTVLCTLPDGVTAIKKALSTLKNPNKEVSTTLSYYGSGKYLLKVSSPEFKETEKQLLSISEGLLDELKKTGCTASFDRSSKKEQAQAKSR